MGTHWEHLSWCLSLMLTSDDKCLHVEVRQRVDRRPKFNFRSTSDFLCDLGEMLTVHPRDVGRELAILGLYTAPRLIAEAVGAFKAAGLT